VLFLLRYKTSFVTKNIPRKHLYTKRILIKYNLLIQTEGGEEMIKERSSQHTKSKNITSSLGCMTKTKFDLDFNVGEETEKKKEKNGIHTKIC